MSKQIYQSHSILCRIALISFVDMTQAMVAFLVLVNQSKPTTYDGRFIQIVSII